MGGWRARIFFMKRYLLHNIHNSDNKNERKKKSKIKNPIQTCFTINLGEKETSNYVYYQCTFLSLLGWSHFELTPLMGKQLLFTWNPQPFANNFYFSSKNPRKKSQSMKSPPIWHVVFFCQVLHPCLCAFLFTNPWLLDVLEHLNFEVIHQVLFGTKIEQIELSTWTKECIK